MRGFTPESAKKMLADMELQYAIALSKAEPITDGREGLKSLELLIAIYLAARDNKTVSLPLIYW